MEIHPLIIQSLRKRVAESSETHGPIVDGNHLFGIVAEELYELLMATHTNDLQTIANEAMDIAVVPIRYLAQLRHLGELDREPGEDPSQETFDFVKDTAQPDVVPEIVVTLPPDETIAEIAYQRMVSEGNLAGKVMPWDMLGTQGQARYLTVTTFVRQEVVSWHKPLIASLVSRVNCAERELTQVMAEYKALETRARAVEIEAAELRNRMVAYGTKS